MNPSSKNRKDISFPVAALLVLTALALLPSPALAAPGDYIVLREFAHDGNGRRPDSQRVVVNGSKIYGMTSGGGPDGYGVVYSMNLDGSAYTLLHPFAAVDGWEPYGSLTLSGSTLYGMTRRGGAPDRGVIFSVGTDGSGYTVLHHFFGGAADGWEPHGSLILSGSTLYGMTRLGGPSNWGVIFSVGTDGSGFTVLHSFAGGATDGRYPFGSLTLSGSTLYGMTRLGGPADSGVVFSLGTDGSGFTVLHLFAAVNGRNPMGSLTLSGSTLFGMTLYGGASDKGVVFSLGTDGAGFAVLHSFAGGAADGRHPSGSLTLSGSTLYGMTHFGGASDDGVLFSLGTDGSGYSMLKSLTGGDGSEPLYESPTISGSFIYGQTLMGGSHDEGVVFSYELASVEPPPVTWDFEDGSLCDWYIQSHPLLTVLRNVVDAEQNGNVIELKANTMDTWFCMAGPGGADLGETNTVAQWSLKSESFFYFYVEVDTTQGPRTLYYTSVGEDKPMEGTYIHHSLAYAAVYNQWCTFTRDLDADLKDAEPANAVTAVNRFCVRGTNMRMDDLSLLAAIPADFDSDGDGLFDVEERDTYGTGLYDADSDDDGLNDGPEVAAWALLGQSWDGNADGNGAVNLLDADSDNDTFDDGTEVAAGSDPGDANDIPPVSYSWDDGGTSGWTVASGLGLVRNVADNGGRAIELRGISSTTFSLKNADGTLWHDNVHDTLTWDMKASSMYYLMVDLQTTGGHRYLLYTPSDTDLGQSGEYLRFGLGVVSKNGTWQSHNRNLAADVSEAEPGNTIQEVNQILYKGPGFFDNVRLQ